MTLILLYLYCYLTNRLNNVVNCLEEVNSELKNAIVFLGLILAKESRSMARKKTIFKEQILEGAIRLLKRDGINNLTARNIADELKCSTQPIYNEYKNMSGLREEIFKHFDDILIEKVFDNFNEEITFEKIAENYVLYASEESLFFYSIYIIRHEFSNQVHRRLSELMTESIERLCPKVEDPSTAWLKLYPMLYGLASLIATEQIDMTDIDVTKEVSTYFNNVDELKY